MLKSIVNVANDLLYNLANSVKLYNVQSSQLKMIRPSDNNQLPHSSLAEFNLSDDEQVEILLREDFYSQVLADLSMQELSEKADEVAKLENLFLEIGVLALCKAASVGATQNNEKYVLRFQVLAASWQALGYRFSNLKRLRKINGLNFNMLSVKSIRILNRLSARIQAYEKTYMSRASSSSLERFEQKNVNLVSAVILVLFNDIIEHDGPQGSNSVIQV